MNFSSTLGLEEIQRAAVLLLFDKLNDALAERAAQMIASDQAFYTHLGRIYEPIEIEPILAENFYEGHRPSLIQAPIEKYPNISAWTTRTSMNAESASSDHTTIYNDLLYIEAMVKSDDEDTVNKRLARTVEAINNVISRNPTLGNVVTGISDERTVNMSDVFARRERTNYGPVWYWQGARLEYVVRKDAVLPSSRSGSLFGATKRLPDGMTAADLALIDQA
jgi:hypothetical protein